MLPQRKEEAEKRKGGGCIWMSFDSGSTLQSCSKNRTYLHNLFKCTCSSSGLYVFTLDIKCFFSNLHAYFQTYTHVLNFPNCLYFFQNHRCLFKHTCIFLNLWVASFSNLYASFQTYMYLFKQFPVADFCLRFEVIPCLHLIDVGCGSVEKQQMVAKWYSCPKHGRSFLVVPLTQTPFHCTTPTIHPTHQAHTAFLNKTNMGNHSWSCH